jgi:hypothetical protein
MRVHGVALRSGILRFQTRVVLVDSCFNSDYGVTDPGMANVQRPFFPGVSKSKPRIGS